MAMNKVQFQKGLSMAEFTARYGSEATCRATVEQARWPQGFCCPKCKHGTSRRFERGGQLYLECTACGRQTSLVSGTLFQASKLPLRLWFLAMHLLSAAKTNLSALELKRHMGVCYRTAWRVKQKIMQAMTAREEGRRLAGFVQIDDAYLGGEINGAKPGRGSPNKQAFLIAVQTDESMERVLYAVAEPLPTFDKEAVAEWAERRLAPECEVYTDGLGAFNALEELGHARTTVVAAGRREKTQTKSARWVNVVLANIKRSLSGVYHSIRQRKYARRYLAEAAWRFNRRFELKALLPRLTVAMVACSPHSERALRKATNYAH
jgi:ribosomal protein L37AE/L43A